MRRTGHSLLLLAALCIGSACTPDAQRSARVPGYATVHDTMPQAIHDAKHRTVERPASEIARSRSLVATNSRLDRIAGTRDAWMQLSLTRRPDETLANLADTLTLLMNCNADSLVVFGPDGSAVTRRFVIVPHHTLVFRDGAHRIRVYGLRPTRAGQRSETLVRTALGGDLVVRTPVSNN